MNNSGLLIEYNGEKKSLIEWSKELNIPYNILNDRITALKWDTEKAFTKPIKSKNKGG